jgi:hypothetical protein
MGLRGAMPARPSGGGESPGRGALLSSGETAEEREVGWQCEFEALVDNTLADRMTRQLADAGGYQHPELVVGAEAVGANEDGGRLPGVAASGR